MSYDQKSLDLVQYFYTEMSPSEQAKVAQAVQDLIESWAWLSVPAPAGEPQKVDDNCPKCGHSNFHHARINGCTFYMRSHASECGCLYRGEPQPQAPEETSK